MMYRQKLIVTRLSIGLYFSFGCSAEQIVDKKGGGFLPSSDADSAVVTTVPGSPSSQPSSSHSSRSIESNESKDIGETSSSVPENNESVLSSSSTETPSPDQNDSGRGVNARIPQIDYEIAKTPIESSGSPLAGGRPMPIVFLTDETKELFVTCSEFANFNSSNLESFRSDCYVVRRPKDTNDNQRPYIPDPVEYTWRFSLSQCPKAQLKGTHYIPNPLDPNSIQPATSVIIERSHLFGCERKSGTLSAILINTKTNDSKTYTATLHKPDKTSK